MARQRRSEERLCEPAAAAVEQPLADQAIAGSPPSSRLPNWDPQRRVFTMGKHDPGTEYLTKLVDEDAMVAAEPIDLETLNRLTQEVFAEPEASGRIPIPRKRPRTRRARRRLRRSPQPVTGEG